MNRVLASVVAACIGNVAVSEEKPVNARDAVEKWVAAALTGNVEAASPWAAPNTSLSKDKGIKEFQQMLQRASLKIPVVVASEKSGRAAAMSEPVQLAGGKPGRDRGCVSFKLKRIEGKWIVNDIDFDDDAKARGKVQSFRDQNADAEESPAKPE